MTLFFGSDFWKVGIPYKVWGLFWKGYVRGYAPQHLVVWRYLPSGYDCYSSPWLSHGPNRNRWFTVLQNGGSFHGYVKNNQMVPYKVCFGLCKGICPQNMVLLRILKFPLRCSMILRGGYNKCSIITKIYGYQVKITERYGHVFDEFWCYDGLWPCLMETNGYTDNDDKKQCIHEIYVNILSMDIQPPNSLWAITKRKRLMQFYDLYGSIITHKCGYRADSEFNGYNTWINGDILISMDIIHTYMCIYIYY